MGFEVVIKKKQLTNLGGLVLVLELCPLTCQKLFLKKRNDIILSVISVSIFLEDLWRPRS